ncbi:excalibur calcium-binding domain-containing protein [Nocardia uniformis]|uniref:Excalibur calcium-binding domain-containing protein n=1 Tax=Nocardia uniformis TaxID=53432 RepID=A0A849C6I9_9NOCA|nr:excalibur calcium-binding domain-containing protein [Nocardia uniformis]NNH72030.1 excalibur calcium-binding domain-containing protein [Nocardia uniformis]
MNRTKSRLARSVSAGLAGAAVATTLLLAAPMAGAREPDVWPPKPSTSESEPRPYYVNCTQVQREESGPLLAGQPGYRPGLDKDGNGIACD